MNYKVSVIIPCYNIDRYLSDCIESILKQTYTNFELLLIDDGSSDETQNICNEYCERDIRVKVFSHENRGVSYTRNKGILYSTGDLLMFVDGDDYIKSDCIEKLVEKYDGGLWPICGMINVRNNQAMNNERYSQLIEKYPDGEIEIYDFFELLKFSSFSSPCARIYSKAIIIKNNLSFNEEITYQEDLIFNLEYSKYVKAAILLNYFGYYYIEHQNSSTGRFHSRFDHIDLLMNDLKKLIRTDSDEYELKRFVFDTTLRKIANLHHSNAPLNNKQKRKELKRIFHSESFCYSYDYIVKSQVNVVLKYLLKIKSPFLVNAYYTRLHS